MRKKDDEKRFLSLHAKKIGMGETEFDYSQLEVVKPAKRKKALWFFPSLGGAAAAMIILAVALPISLSGNSSSGNNQGQASIPAISDGEEGQDTENETTQVPGDPLPPLPSGKRERIGDFENVQVEYESNLYFVSDGLTLDYMDGSGRLVSQSDVEVDYDDFSAGVPGTYEIKVSSGERSASYSANVIESEVTSISVSFDKGAYYGEEKPLPSDFTITKTRDDGSTSISKNSEVGLDLSAFEQGEVTVYLKSNPEFREVVLTPRLPIEEVSFSGKWGWKEDFHDYGMPSVLAFTVNPDNVFSISYYDIFLSGTPAMEEDGGRLHLSFASTTQDAYYDPATRVMSVTGIAGDPPLDCFMVPPGSTSFEVYSSEHDSSRDYVALGGYMDEETYNHILYAFGDLYLDSEFATPFTLDTPIQQGQILFAKAGGDGSYNAYFQGYWFSSIDSPFSEIRLYVEGGTFTTFSSKKERPYSYSLTPTDLILRLGVGQCYFLSQDGQRLESRYQGETVYSLSKVDLSEKAIVTFLPDMQRYALSKGETLPAYTVDDDGKSMEIYNYVDYDGSPIYADSSFSCFVSRVDVYTYLGHYGDASDYYVIGGGLSYGLSDSHGEYFVIRFEDYKMVDYAKFAFKGRQGDKNALSLDFAILGEKEAYVYYSSGSSFLEIDGQATKYNHDFLSGYPFVGTYHTKEGEEAKVTDYGTIEIKQTDSTGYEYVHSISFLLTSYDELSGNAGLRCSHEVGYDGEIEVFETALAIEDGRYAFSCLGKTYFQDK